MTEQTQTATSDLVPPLGGRRLEDLPDLLTVDELADFLQVPKATVYYWRVKGDGPIAMTIGKHVRFAKDEVRSWLATRPARA